MTNKNLNVAACVLGLSVSFIALPVLAAGASAWDTNADKKLDKTEFKTGFDRSGVFKKWDTDADGKLSQLEFKAGMAKHEQAFNGRFGNDAYVKWDSNRDNYISAVEFNDGVYASYDKNRSNVIDEPELNDVGDDMGDGGLFDV